MYDMLFFGLFWLIFVITWLIIFGAKVPSLSLLFFVLELMHLKRDVVIPLISSVGYLGWLALIIILLLTLILWERRDSSCQSQTHSEKIYTQSHRHTYL